MTITAELPDGRTLEFPDDTKPDVVKATVKRVLGVKAEEKPAEPAPKSGAEIRKSVLAKPDAVDAVADVPRTLVQNQLAKILSGYAGIAGTVLPGKTGQGAEWQKNTEEALSHNPAHPATRAALTAAGLPYEYLVEKPAHAIGNKIAEKGAPATGAITEGAIEAAPMLFGMRSFKPTISPTVELARKYKFGLTPSEGGGGFITKTVEGLSGEEKLSKGVAKGNAEKAARALADEIGIAADAEVTRESIAAARRAAHAPYEEARSLGEIQAGPAYAKALDAIEQQYKSASKSFPNARKNTAQEVMETVEGYRVPSFDASSAIDQIKTLREDANRAYAKGDGALGKAYKSLATAIEDALVEHVEALGKNQPALLAPHRGLVDRLKQARTRIAKSYEMDKALDKDGAINPQKYRDMEKKGKPLSGAAKDVATLAEDAPRSFRRDTGGNVLFPTWADVIMGGVASGAEGAAHGLASGGATLPLMFARPAARAIMSSEPYQAFQASTLPQAGWHYTPITTMAARIAADEADKERKANERSR